MDDDCRDRHVDKNGYPLYNHHTGEGANINDIEHWIRRKENEKEKKQNKEELPKRVPRPTVSPTKKQLK